MLNNNNNYFIIDIYHLNGPFSHFWVSQQQKSSLVGLTWRAVNGRVPQIYFAFPFAQIAKEKLITFNKMKENWERLITAVRRENDVKRTVPPIDAALETPSH